MLSDTGDAVGCACRRACTAPGPGCGGPRGQFRLQGVPVGHAPGQSLRVRRGEGGVERGRVVGVQMVQHLRHPFRVRIPVPEPVGPVRAGALCPGRHARDRVDRATAVAGL